MTWNASSWFSTNWFTNYFSGGGVEAEPFAGGVLTIEVVLRQTQAVADLLSVVYSSGIKSTVAMPNVLTVGHTGIRSVSHG